MQAHAAQQALRQELEYLKRSSISADTEEAVRLATVEANAEAARLKRAIAELEARALTELNEMHEELLEMREACYKLEQALEDFESKRCVFTLHH